MKYTKMVGEIINELAERKALRQDMTMGSDRYVEMLETDGFDYYEARDMVTRLINATIKFG